jgi:protein-tyrosine phosphatase
MTEVGVVVVCAECRVHWYADDEALCTTAGHGHQRLEIHRHRSLITLPDGTRVTAVSFDPEDPYNRDSEPDYGLYLDHRWQPPWPHNHLDWPDFGVPATMPPVLAALQSVLAKARAGERVELGCLGGHGRTGTALACLAAMTGQPADTAVDWIRANYCGKAVKTTEQEEFVRSLLSRGR